MPISFELQKPALLTEGGISRQIEKKSPGVYLLSSSAKSGSVTGQYVGRADDDVARRLRAHIGKYTHFVYAYASSAADAFSKECELYHEFSPGNALHPRPPREGMKCPRCKVFG